MAHVYLKEYASPGFVDKAPKIVQYINEMEETNGKVLAIAMTYAASQNLVWGQDEPGVPGGDFDDMALIGPLAETDTTLYKLNGEGSPFKENLKFVRGATGGVTTDYFQYMILIRRSPAAEPYYP